MSHPTGDQIVYLPAGSLAAGAETVTETVEEPQENGNVVTDSESGQVVGESTAGESSILDKIGSFFAGIADTVKGWFS